MHNNSEDIPRLEMADLGARAPACRRYNDARVRSSGVRSAPSAPSALAVTIAGPATGVAPGAPGAARDSLASPSPALERAHDIGLDRAAGHVGDSRREDLGHLRRRDRAGARSDRPGGGVQRDSV